MEESRTIKSTKNIISSFALKTLGMVLSFVSRTVFIRVFGVEMLGISGLFDNILVFLSLADLGFATAMTYSYYKPIADNDEVKIAQLNHFNRKVYNVIALAITVIGLALMPFLKYIVNLETTIDHMYLYYILTLASTVMSYLFVYKTTVLTAYQKTYILSKYYLIVSFISAVSKIAVMLITKNYIVTLCTVIFFSFLNNFVASRAVDKHYPFVNKKVEALSKADQKDIFSNLKSVFLYKVSSVLMNSTDNIIISKIIGTIFVGFYSNYLTVINMISGYISIMFSSLTASIGNIMVKDSNEKQYHIFKNIQSVSAWCCIVISSCVYALINDFITVWVGKEFILDNLTVIAIAINFFLSCLLQPIWIYREAAGIYRKTKYIMVICAVLNVVLSIILGKLIGMSGVIFASIISKLLTYIWYEPIVLFRDFFKKSPLGFFASIFGITALTVLVSGALWFVNQQIVINNGFIGFIVKGVACFAISNVVFLIIYCRNKYFIEVLEKVKSLLLSFLKRRKAE